MVACRGRGGGEKGRLMCHSLRAAAQGFASVYYSGMVIYGLRCLPLGTAESFSSTLLCYAFFSKLCISSGGVGGSPNLHPTFYVECTTNNIQN